MIRAGKLDRTIRIERMEKGSPTATGTRVPAWTEFATVRAELVKWSASEFSTGFGEAESGTVIFRTWYIPGITMADRIIYEGRAHDLKEIAEIGRRRGLELRAVAVS